MLSVCVTVDKSKHITHSIWCSENNDNNNSTVYNLVNYEDIILRHVVEPSRV